MKVTVVNINNFSSPKFDVSAHFEKYGCIHNGSLIECEREKLVVSTIIVNKDGSMSIEAM